MEVIERNKELRIAVFVTGRGEKVFSGGPSEHHHRDHGDEEDDEEDDEENVEEDDEEDDEENWRLT